MKSKVSVKMSEENIKFWKKLNVNAIKTDNIQEIISYSNLQEAVVNYFKINNDRYLELLELIKETEEKRNGTK